MFNKAVLMGRICTDLVLKSTPAGATVLSFRLAVERNYAAKGEERKTDFFNIVAWRSTAEFISRYFSKGKMILVEGELQTRQYVDKNGSNQNVVELVVNSANFTGEKKEQQATQPVQQPPVSTTNGNGQGSQGDFSENDIEDYPF